MRTALASTAIVLALTCSAPAHATISFGDLMYTDLFSWQGQFGTPTWREILEFYDCSPELGYYLNNKPQRPPPHVDPPPPIDPPPCTDCDPPPPCVDCDPPPPCMNCDPPPATPVPEASTWAMLILGFASIALMHRNRRLIS